MMKTIWEISWSDFTNEIDNGRPVLVNVDADGDGLAEHMATAVGYDDNTMEYAIYNTWDHDLHWYNWHEESGFDPYGIYGLWFMQVFTGGSVIHVPADYPTFQDAINAAEAGDTILVSDGIYSGNGNRNIDLLGKPIVIISEKGPECTILDGLSSPSYNAFRVIDNNNPYAEISGFTFRNWDASYGAVYLIDAKITLSNNIFTDNNNSNGAIYCGGYYCTPLIRNNTIAGNTGGGIRAEWYAAPVVKNTIVFENELFEASALEHGAIAMSYSIVRGGYTGNQNVFENPMFIDVYGGDLNVFANSPCINGGDPSDTDPDGTRADIGAFFGMHPGYYDNGDVIHVDKVNGSSSGDGSEELPFDSINRALRQSRHGDTVLVMPGTYFEEIDYYGHNAVVTSRYLRSDDIADIESTIIMNPYNSSHVVFRSYENNSAALIGFTLTGGYAENGGAIYCMESDPTIACNFIHDNIALYYGGGIYIVNSNAILRGNLIYDNDAYWFGGGIYVAFSELQIDHCTVTRNSGNELSGGLYSWNSEIDMVNSIFWGNIAPYMADTYIYAGSCNVSYCDLGTAMAGEGNMSCDPMFCGSESSDFTLNGNSPCLGAGLNGENIGALGLGCGEMITVIIPDSMHIKYADLVEPMIAEIYFGNFFEAYTASDINPSSVTVNDGIIPQSIELVSGYEGFVGECWRLQLPVKGFIESYGLIWGTSDYPFTVSGEYNDNQPFEVMGTVKMTGHRPGDINLDGRVNVIDILFLVDYKFREGPPPEPLEIADFNCDEIVNILDILYLISFEYNDGPEPMSECN